jgi:hypothetical protein
MNRRLPPIILLLLHSSLARADGGDMRLCERSGNYQLAVFTAPAPFRAGPVDVSVLVQDAATGECMPQARVMLRMTAHESGRVLEYPATSGTASNKLFHAALNSASTGKTLGFMCVVAVIGVPIVLAYTITVYYVFRGKVVLTEELYWASKQV